MIRRTGRASAILLAVLSTYACSAASRAGSTRSGYIPVSGGDSIYYESRGSGAPIILIHGGFVDRTMWDAHFERLAARYHVVRYDIRGFGRSPLPQARYSPIDDVSALLDRLGIQRAVLVGLSMGGSIALDYTLTHPERVAALALVASGPSGQNVPDDAVARIVELFTIGREKGASAAAARWLEHPMLAATMANPRSRDVMRRLAEDNGRFFTLPFWPTTSIDPPAAGRLGEVRVPTLVIGGGADTPVNREGAELLGRGIPGARYEVIASAAHMIPIEEPDAFDRLLSDFLAALPDW